MAPAIPVFAQETPTPSPKASAAAEARDTLEEQTFFLINQYRKSAGLPLLTWDGGIASVARDHSRDMASGEVDFGHAGFGDRVRKIKHAMAGLSSAGENVLMTNNPDQMAQAAVAIWLKSPHHRENIRGDFNYSGLGVSTDKDGMVYFTQIFVKIQPPSPQTMVAPPPGIEAPLGLMGASGNRFGP